MTPFWILPITLNDAWLATAEIIYQDVDKGREQEQEQEQERYRDVGKGRPAHNSLRCLVWGYGRQRLAPA